MRTEFRYALPRLQFQTRIEINAGVPHFKENPHAGALKGTPKEIKVSPLNLTPHAASKSSRVTEICGVIISLLPGVDVNFTGSAANATSSRAVHAAKTSSLPSSGAV